jgi:hypothetical protein
MKERIDHARTVEGGALCEKPLARIEDDRDLLLGPWWDAVTCPACNDRRLLFKTPEDLACANGLLNRL